MKKVLCVNQQLLAYYSELPVRHNQQLVRFSMLQNQMDEARSSLFDSQTAELDALLEMKLSGGAIIHPKTELNPFHRCRRVTSHRHTPLADSLPVEEVG